MDATNISYIGVGDIETDLISDIEDDNIINYINQITIDCLVNKNFVNKNINQNIDKETLLDIKFYRKRIYNLVNLLSTSENIRTTHPNIFSAFVTFSKILINHFETEDKNYILQNYHKQDEICINEPELEITGGAQSVINDDIQKCNALVFNNNVKELRNPTLDTFIIKPERTNTTTLDDISISASRREIHLRNPKFRKKQF